MVNCDMANEKMIVNGITVNTKTNGNVTYISLTDVARLKNPKDPRFVIQTWLKSKETIAFVGLWEILNNPEFNRVEFDTVKDKEAGYNAFSISPKEWIDRTNAIGIVSTAGRYDSGTFAHQDIAFEFASWVSPEFKLYLIKEFQRLKQAEQAQLQWTARRELTKLNYHLHTDAIKENIVPTLTDKQKQFVYQDEADVLNVALFGSTARQWRDKNTDKPKNENMRDYASIHQLLVLANMESYNASMIKDGIDQSTRIQKLNDMARYQLPILTQSNSPLLLGEH